MGYFDVQMKLFETLVILDGSSGVTGVTSSKFSISAGSRAIFTLSITAIDPATTISLAIKNGFSISEPFTLLDTISASGTGQIQRAYSDLHSIFEIEATVTGGSAAFKVACTMSDNSGQTRLGDVTINLDPDVILPVSGPLTDEELRDSPVPVTGEFFQVTQPVSGPVTDSELRAAPVPVSGTFFQATQPVSGPLTDAELRASPVSVDASIDKSGLATDTLQADGNDSLASIDSKLSDQATAAKQDTGNASLASIDSKLTHPLPVTGTFFQTTQPVSGPLTDAELRATAVLVDATIDKTGLATDSLQLDGNTSLDSIDTKLSSQATAAKQDTGNASLASIDSKLTNPLPVSGTFFQATQPVSGPLTDAQLRASPVPVTASIDTTGLATDAKQDVGNASLSSIDGKTPALVTGRVPVDGSGVTQPVSGTFWQATQPVSGTFWQTTQPVSGTFWQSVQPVSGTFWQATQPVSAASLPLPAGASTESKQDTGNASLGSIDTKLSSQATAAKQDTGNASLASIDSKLTSPLSVQGKDADGANWTSNPVIMGGKSSTDVDAYSAQAFSAETVGADGNGNAIYALPVKDFSGGAWFTDSFTLDSGAPLHYLVGGNKNQTLFVEITGTWGGTIQLKNASGSTEVAVEVRNIQTNAVSASITANGVYAVYGAIQESMKVDSSGLTGSADIFAIGGLYETDVYAHIVGAVPLPTGAATGAKQDTGNTSVASIDTKTPALGQAAMAASSPVVIASNQSAVPVTGTFFQSTQPVSIASMPTTPVTLAAGAAAIAKTEDSASADADVGVPAMAIQKATPADTAGTDGDYAMLQMAAGRLWTSSKIDTALPAGSNVIGHVIVDTAPTTAVTGPLTDTQLRATAVPVSLASLPSLAAGSALVGKVGIDQTTPGTTNGVQVNAALPAGTNRIGSVRPVDSADADLTVAKGIQTSRAMSTQDLKDSGRVHLQLFATAAASGATGVETLITLTKSSAFGATSSGTDYTITSGKRFRITSITFASRGNATATIQVTTFTLRINAGAVATGSTAWLSARTATPATASTWDRFQLPIPDGLELLGDGTNRIGVSANAVFTTNAPTWDVCITGYEY